jgi:hypothetical protein
MSIAYDHVAGTLRGDARAVESLRSRLQDLHDPAELSAAMQEAGVTPPVTGDDQFLDAVRVALGTPILTLELTVTGPGGEHRHVIDAGVNAAAVRWSTARPDLAELSASPFLLLPGGMARLVRFRPGAFPLHPDASVPVPRDAIVELAAEAKEERIAAWETVRDLLDGHIDVEQADASWQLVRSHCRWVAVDGEEAEDMSVHLRAGDHYFVLVEAEDSLSLVPVPSVTAFETMVRVLPGSDEVKDPRS